jgi:glycosyltransferase involved in cell wall biosynthesis
MPKVILVANTDWYLYNYRLDLACHLREQGYEVVLVSPAGKYTPEFARRGFPWRRWEVGRQTLAPWRELGAVLRLGQLYRRERPDLVHHHTIKPVLYGSLAARFAGETGVVNSITGRGYIFSGKEARAHLLRGGVRWLYRLALNRSRTAVIFENSADREYFLAERFIPPGRAYLIPGVGVDPERFRPAPEPEGDPVILFSGRLLWDKGVGLLVEAARLLQAQTRVRVALAGEPDPGNPGSIPEETIRGWAQAGMVEWWGWQTDMNTAYARSHIVAMPTMYAEGVPTVLLEAAACGRPVVASDAPGCREIARDGLNGLVVPPGDVPALAEALLRLATDPALRGRMGSAGRQLVLDGYTTAQVNAATLDVFGKVLPAPQ